MRKRGISLLTYCSEAKKVIFSLTLQKPVDTVQTDTQMNCEFL